MRLSAAGRFPVSPPSSRDFRYRSHRRITPLASTVEIGVLISSAISMCQTQRSINGSTRLLSRTQRIHSRSAMLHATSQPSAHLGTRTGTCRFRSIGASEISLGCNSGLRCTTLSIVLTSTLRISFRDRARHSAQSATPSQPEIPSSGSNSSGEEELFNVGRFVSFDRLLTVAWVRSLSDLSECEL
jgi:hypothetical protein